jgi:hypothetical protein
MVPKYGSELILLKEFKVPKINHFILINADKTLT